MSVVFEFIECNMPHDKICRVRHIRKPCRWVLRTELAITNFTRSKEAREKIDLDFRCLAKMLDVRTCNMWKK
jgi:hypothetical protein